jgi:predicted TIM-barrel fold metal-dependent hydrolase
LGMHYAQAELDTLDLSAEVRRKIERDNALALLGVDDGASES